MGETYDTEVEIPDNDVCALVDQAVSHFGRLDGVPCEPLIEASAGYQLKRRRRR